MYLLKYFHCNDVGTDLRDKKINNDKMTTSKKPVMSKIGILTIFFLISGFAFSQTIVTLEDQCNCEVLSGTDITVAGSINPTGADIGDIYVNTNTGIIYFWDGDSWELTSSDNNIINPSTPINIDIDGDGTTEATVKDAIQDIVKIISKSAKIFYPPSIEIDASTIGTSLTVDLYLQYTNQYTTPTVASSGAPSSIPTYVADDLYYYVTHYNTDVFTNVSVDESGMMTYDVIAPPLTYNSLINVVFVVK